MEVNYNVYVLGRNDKIRLLAGLLLGGAVIGYLFYESLLIGVLFLGLYKPVEKFYASYMMKKRKNALTSQFKDFLYSISSSFATGRHMEESLVEARENLNDVYSSDEPIMAEIDQMINRIKMTGDTDIAVLDDFSKRSHIEDIENFTEVFRACRETGGDLVSSMNKSAAIIGEKITIENEIRVMASQKKMEGRIITLMPVVIILFLRIMSPEYLSVMYNSLAGRILMTLALGATCAAYVWIERITEIEV